MQNIQLHNPEGQKTTSVSNIFIDCYMPKADGMYVKLYLCLLRQSCERESVSLEVIADLFDCTEKDVQRGLQYWADQGLVKLTLDADNKPCGLAFLVPKRPENHLYTAASAIPPKKELSADRISALSDNQDIKQLLFIAESYLGKTLSPSEITSLLYYYDSLHFHPDLIEYLIEYCISRGSTSFHYMDKVALGWAQAGVKTVRDAKENSSLYGKKYYRILNVFGIKGRGPAKPEVAMIDHWFEDLHFTDDIILEACSRTITQTQRPNFQYANRILENWHKNGIRHLSDIRTLDEQHHQKSAARKAAPKTAASNNKFNNFSQRDYDFQQLESQLLNQ